MAREVNRGEIWQYTFNPPDKRRPVLVIGRQKLLEILTTATVVPITTTFHGSDVEVELGIDDGLKTQSCANFANIQTVSKARLTRFIGTVRPEKLHDICRALAVAAGCD